MANMGYNSSDKANDSTTYFAAKPATDTAAILMARAQSFYNLLTANSYLEKLQNMWRMYHGAYQTDMGVGHRIQFTGEQGELVHMPVNHFRNLAQHIYVMITSNRPIMEARAVNTDYKSLAQTYLAKGILDYYMREKHLEDALKKAVEMSIVLGSGFVKLEWNATGGNTFDADPDTGEIDYEGEMEFTNLSPFDVVVDGTQESWNNDWILCRTFQNRFNLIAKYPELEDKIRAIPPKSESSVYRLAAFSNDDTDDIPVYEFYHKRDEAMPDGRYLLFLDTDCILLDTKMPYRTIPVFRIVPSEIMGTPYGYSPMFDIYPIQEMLNATYSAIATNQNAFAVQNVFIKRGSDIVFSNLDGAMNIIEANEPPQALNLTQTPKEVFEYLNILVQAAETISGVNSVARGNPEASLKSGTALALVQSMALQFTSGLQQSYVQLIEDVGSALIHILKDFATTPKFVALVGKNNRPFIKEFIGEDISAINRVIVDVGNPLSMCLAKDTPVLMFDGNIKMIQDVKIGEQLMGPDSYPRTVGNINNGEEMMYEIVSKDSNRNIRYGCNESHILTLKYCSDDYRYDAKQGDILDITVRDYLKLSDRQKRLLQGFTTGVEYEKKNLVIPPYILGAWLGDGTSRNTSLTTMDPEMVEEWTNYGTSIGMQIRVQENRQPNKSKVYFITSGESYGKSDRNPFMNELRERELILNKHIPFDYLTSSRKDRLELLAGLIDTDGHRIDETFIFTQKNERLTNEVVHLAKSLGFRVTCKKIKVSPNKFSSLESEMFKVSIGGNTDEIPNRLPRKMAKKKDKARDWLNYGINVTSKGEGTYYGITLVEEPHFLLGDFTVTHNTIAGRVQMAEQLMQMNLIKTPQQYFSVMDTGRLDSMYEGTMDDLLCIKSENEKLMEGQPVRATMLDLHKMHIIEHRAVLSDPDVRNSPNDVLVTNALDHIQQHINYLRTTDPQLLALIGETPLPPEPQPGQPPPGAPHGGPMPPQPPHPPGPPPPGPGGPPPPHPAPQKPQGSSGGPQGGRPLVAHGLPQSKDLIAGIQAANAGQAKSGDRIAGPGQEAGEKLPNLPKVPASLLPAAYLQQQTLNNVNLKK